MQELGGLADTTKMKVLQKMMTAAEQLLLFCYLCQGGYIFTSVCLFVCLFGSRITVLTHCAPNLVEG